MSKKKKKKKKRIARSEKQKQSKSMFARSGQNIQFINRPALSEIDAPPGFRAVSMSQAIIEYAKPLLDFVEEGIVKVMNDALQLSMHIWNYALSPEHKGQEKIKKDIIKKIGKTLKMNSQESSEFFEEMVQRKNYLLPPEIQPDTQLIALTMFIRQEERHLIPEFNYDSLNISEEPHLPDVEDEQLVQLINQMDKYIAEDVDYGEWEDFYFSMEEKCEQRFEKWLIIKGGKEYSENFPNNIEIYLNFVYRYMHKDIINLKTIKPIYVEEFFVDHLLRKVMVEPHEYIEWPPAIKLFYKFLDEIGYLKSPEKIIKLFDKIEPHFLKILRNRYS